MDIDLKFVILGIIVALIIVIIIYAIVYVNKKLNSKYYITDVSGKWVYDIDKDEMRSIENLNNIKPLNIVSYGNQIYMFNEWWNLEKIQENNSVIPYQTNHYWLKTGENKIQRIKYENDFGYNIEDGMIIHKFN